MEMASEVGVGKEAAPPATSSSSSIQHDNWKEAQDFLRKKLITEDDFTWKIARPGSGTTGEFMEEEVVGEVLKYVGGVDISFSKEGPSVACGTLVVLDLHSLQVVYEDFSLVTLQVPYVPGFLAFREAPVLLELLEKMKNNACSLYPQFVQQAHNNGSTLCPPLCQQVLMVDGNGILHPRGFGLACHLGVLSDLPTIGIGKNLHHMDGLTLSGVRQLLKGKDHDNEDFIPLTGCSGRIWGVAMRSTEGSMKPIFISTGHRISLDTAIRIVKMVCKYRVPEPTRQLAIEARSLSSPHPLVNFATKYRITMLNLVSEWDLYALPFERLVQLSRFCIKF
ncbi:hypothetical protein FNV43_RR11199 [Rhamnella rubrinervis]|uniref:Endonuclease V n=1 Tax=Rhamnella rubrinervis TaxID=2594499 RepID=A0A8K0H5D2_9ROSA|nr:hypothetical protein FNV43_RR11199 [Rhamnella rubrinervis]